MEQTYKNRMRINFSQSTKNKVTCEVTFEGLDCTKEEAIKNATELLNEAVKIAEQKSKELGAE